MKDLLIDYLRMKLQSFIFGGELLEVSIEEADLDPTTDIDFTLEDDDEELDRDSLVWILSETGLKQVFAIARSEHDDDLALMEVVANTSWSDDPDDYDDEEGYE